MECLPVDIAQNIYHRACLIDLKGRSKNVTFRFTFGKDKNFRYEFRRIDVVLEKHNILANLMNMYEISIGDYRKHIEKITMEELDSGVTVPEEYEDRYNENYASWEGLTVPTMETLMDLDRVVDAKELEYLGHYDNSKDDVVRGGDYMTSVVLTQHLRDYFDLDFLKEFYMKKVPVSFFDDPWDDVEDSDEEFEFNFPPEMTAITIE